MAAERLRVGSEYEAVREPARRALVERKRPLRVPLGEGLTLVWESRVTLLGAAEESLRADRSNDPAVAAAALEAFAPLLPGGGELVAFLYVDTPDAAEQGRLAAELSGLERTVSLEIEGRAVLAAPALEPDAAHAELEGVSVPAVHALRFRLGDHDRRALEGGAEIAVSVDHPSRRARIVLSEAETVALAALLGEP